MSINNFKELERLTIAEQGRPPQQIIKNISKNMSIFRFIGDLIELYLPNFGKALVRMSGGPANSKTNPPSKYPNQI